MSNSFPVFELRKGGFSIHACSLVYFFYGVFEQKILTRSPQGTVCVCVATNDVGNPGEFGVAFEGQANFQSVYTYFERVGAPLLPLCHKPTLACLPLADLSWRDRLTL